jgi:hypothetical protein
MLHVAGHAANGRAQLDQHAYPDKGCVDALAALAPCLTPAMLLPSKSSWGDPISPFSPHGVNDMSTPVWLALQLADTQAHPYQGNTAHCTPP